MKKRVIVVCAGNLLKKKITAINSVFEIVALADNNRNGEIVEGFQCIGIKDIQLYNYDIIIICSILYEAVIREQLIDAGIESVKICDIESLDKYLYFNMDIQKYKEDKSAYMRACQARGIKNFLYDEKNELPKLTDYRECAGNIDQHYFLTDIMMAREVIKRKPKKHYDIGSRIEGFISHLIVGNINTTIIDIRPLNEINSGNKERMFDFLQADATNLKNIKDSSVESLSALHSVEHFGLGRYGDFVEPEAHTRVMKSMVRVLKFGGYLYFAVPVGKKEKLCFNAHRVFSPLTILENFEELALEKMWLLHKMQFHEYSADELREEKYRDVIGSMIVGYIFSEKISKKS